MSIKIISARFPSLISPHSRPYIDAFLRIMFEVSKDSPTRVEILSIDGKLIYAQEQFLNKGPQQMRISKEMITGAGSGIFLVKVTSEESTKTTQFILVD